MWSKGGGDGGYEGDDCSDDSNQSSDKYKDVGEVEQAQFAKSGWHDVEAGRATKRMSRC
jgi:hypothetical protein